MRYGRVPHPGQSTRRHRHRDRCHLGCAGCQAQVTERSLAQTERGLAEQVQSLREQNERARLTLEYDLLSRLTDRSLSPYFLSRRRAAATYLLDNAFVENEMVEVERLNRAGWEVCAFFEEVGEPQRLGVLRAESVWNRLALGGQAYCLLCKPAIEKRRKELKDPTLYEEFERLNGVLADIDRERGVADPTQEVLRQIMEGEATIGGEPPTTTE